MLAWLQEKFASEREQIAMELEARAQEVRTGTDAYHAKTKRTA